MLSFEIICVLVLLKKKCMCVNTLDFNKRTIKIYEINIYHIKEFQ